MEEKSVLNPKEREKENERERDIW